MTSCVVQRLTMCLFVMFFVCLRFFQLINLKGLHLLMHCDEESQSPQRFAVYNRISWTTDDCMHSALKYTYSNI